MITTGRGTNIAPVWSPGRHAARLSAHRSAELRRPLRRRRDGRRRRLAGSRRPCLPVSTTRAFVEPEFVHYPGPDGQQVPGWLYVPANLDRSRKHPAIVWIHGDGVNQNYDGWHVQRNYAVYSSFHQYLLQQGYVVFAPDYRGSIGYGRDWRQGVYMDVGGKDAKDAWMAANYLKTLELRGHGSRRRLGSELRRVLHADRGHRSTDALPRRRRRRRRRRLRDVLRGSVSRRLDDDADRDAASRTRRSTSKPRRSRMSIVWSGRCWCCTARPT